MTGTSTRQTLSRPGRVRSPEPARAAPEGRAPVAAEARTLGNAFTVTCGGGDEETMTTTAGCPLGLTQTCSGGCAGCGKESSTLTPDEDIGSEEAVTADAGPVAPAAPVGNSCSPTSAKFTSIPSGKIAAAFGAGRFGAPFSMEAEFETPIPCTCVSGEYRQSVRGFFKRNGTAITHRLCSNTLDPTTWHEDCATIGGKNYMYGYHSIPFATSKFSKPDQATGCTYTGKDHPGINTAAAAKGDVLEVHLEFEGRLVDASDGDRVLKSSSWSVEGKGTVA